MRDIIFRDCTSSNKKRKELIMSEVIEEKGLVTRTEKRAIYIIKDKTKVRDPLKLKTILLNQPSQKATHPGHLSIRREISTKEGKQVFICKNTGNFQAVTSGFVFSIDFVRLFKMELTSSKD